MSDVLQDQVTAGPGGVMTAEVGVVTGDLTLVTRDCGDGHADVSVQYTGAAEWYTVAGSPVRLREGGLPEVHDTVLKRAEAGDGADLSGI